MDQFPTSAVICYRTGPIKEVGGHVLLIGACYSREFPLPKESIQEFFVVFPNDEGNIGNCIINTTEDEDISFFSDFERDARSNLKMAESALCSWARQRSLELADDIKDAVSKGQEICKSSSVDIHHFDLLVEHLIEVKARTKVPLLESWINPLLKLSKATQD
jgi:hypothetical protein